MFKSILFVLITIALVIVYSLAVLLCKKIITKSTLIFIHSDHKILQAILIIPLQILLYYNITLHFMKKRISFEHTFVQVSLGFIIALSCIGFSILILWLMKLNRFTINEVYFKHTVENSLKIILFFLVLALFEEVVFRGILYTNLRSHFSLLSSMVISTLLFVVLHLKNAGINITSIISITLGALILNLLTEYTGDIWMSLGFHFSWNLIQGIMGYTVSGDNEMISILISSKTGSSLLTGGEFGIEASPITLSVLLLITTILVTNQIYFQSL